MTQVQALVLLFVVLPFVVAGGVIAFINWRSSATPPPVRTSTVLATGDPGDGEVLAIRSFGGLLDTKPMVRLDLRVTTAGRPAFDLQVTQSLPRPFAAACAWATMLRCVSSPTGAPRRSCRHLPATPEAPRRS